LPSLAAPTQAAEPIRVIFDTDMDTDCDDLGALAVLHALADRGEAEILATVVSSRNVWSPACVDAVNTFYGRPDLPIGRPGADGPDKASRYTKQIAERFPHSIQDVDQVPLATSVYRDVLAQQPDGSVVIVTVGYLTNLAELLALPATDTHPSGRELVEKKVKHWVCMGGNFVGSPPADDLKLGNNNFTIDADAAYTAVTEWPGLVTFVGREIGSVPSGLKVGANLKSLPDSNPIKAGYEYYFGGTAKDRHVADQTTVLFAMRGTGEFWDVHSQGFMDLQENMKFQWRLEPDKEQAYLTKRTVDGKTFDREVEAVIDGLMLAEPQSD
jgi:hypothetical protein